MKKAEREKGFEPSTSTLARWPDEVQVGVTTTFEVGKEASERTPEHGENRMRTPARHEIRHEIGWTPPTGSRALGALLLALALGACGGVAPTPPEVDGGEAADGTTPAPDGGAEASPDARDTDAAECWRCADRAWRNVCAVPAVRGTDAESCVHCGEHCNSSDGG